MSTISSLIIAFDNCVVVLILHRLILCAKMRCPVCNRVHKRSELPGAIYEHLEYHKYACEDCNSTFAYLDEFVQHCKDKDHLMQSSSNYNFYKEHLTKAIMIIGERGLEQVIASHARWKDESPFPHIQEVECLICKKNVKRFEIQPHVNEHFKFNMILYSCKDCSFADCSEAKKLDHARKMNHWVIAKQNHNASLPRLCSVVILDMFYAQGKDPREVDKTFRRELQLLLQQHPQRKAETPGPALKRPRSPSAAHLQRSPDNRAKRSQSVACQEEEGRRSHNGSGYHTLDDSLQIAYRDHNISGMADPLSSSNRSESPMIERNVNQSGTFNSSVRDPSPFSHQSVKSQNTTITDMDDEQLSDEEQFDSSGLTTVARTRPRQNVERATCTKCAIVISGSAQNLRNHIGQHEGSLSLACVYPDCSKTFNQVTNLKAHIKNDHHEEFSLLSDEVFTRYRRSLDEFNKMADRHMRMYFPDSYRNPENCVQCKICHFVFRRNIGLKAHASSHLSFRLTCPIEGCQHKFASTKYQKEHLKIMHGKRSLNDLNEAETMRYNESMREFSDKTEEMKKECFPGN